MTTEYQVDEELELEVRDVEQRASGARAQVKRFAKADLPPAVLPAMVELYNRSHAQRS